MVGIGAGRTLLIGAAEEGGGDFVGFGGVLRGGRSEEEEKGG